MDTTTSEPIQQTGPQPGDRTQYRAPQDTVLRAVTLQIERKEFELTVRQNHRGRFLRISENSNGRYNNVCIPEPGIPEFVGVLKDLTGL